MKKILQQSFLLLALIVAGNINAQTVRYLDEVFTNVTVDSNIVYGQNKGFLTGFAAVDTLKMDIYHPTGDTATNRPVIILMHAGSFLPGSLTGFTFADRKENCLVELCQRYAKRGYVAVSMSYRLGWNPSSTDFDIRSGTIINAVYRAMQDAKNCVRYFRNDATNGTNQWGIDGNKFVLGGSNSGAYVALAAGNLNKPAELEIPKFLDVNGLLYIDTVATGNFEGFGGSQNVDNLPGISSAFNAVLALGGAVADTSYIEAGEVPVIAFQGVNEGLTPYNTAVVVTSTFNPVVEVSGSGDFMPVVAAMGNNNVLSPNFFGQGPPNRQGGVATTSIEGLYPFWGQAFEPWNWYVANPIFNPSASQSKAMLYIDTIMGYSTPRLYRLLVDNSYQGTTGIYEPKGNVEMQVYPNPASGVVNVFGNSLQQPISTIQLFDISGRLTMELNNINAHYKAIDLSQMHRGLYLLTVKLSNGESATQRLVIE